MNMTLRDSPNHVVYQVPVGLTGRPDADGPCCWVSSFHFVNFLLRPPTQFGDGVLGRIIIFGLAAGTTTTRKTGRSNMQAKMKYETQTDRPREKCRWNGSTQTRDAAEYRKKNAGQGRLDLESGKTPDESTPSRHVSRM